MSTFKKLLALTLALAMVLSVSAFAGYKADTYKDAAGIDEDCEDAIELMYALDIMKGDANGNFNPTATIKRAEIAKMIASTLSCALLPTRPTTIMMVGPVSTLLKS